MLTDDQIFNIGWEISMQDIKTIPEYKLAFARAIEAEATKPQEPFAWAYEGLDGRVTFYHASVPHPMISTPLYNTPQPCPKCAEQDLVKGTAVEVAKSLMNRNAELVNKCTELEQRLQAHEAASQQTIAELEAELREWNNMSACEACATIPAVMEYVTQLEAERDALKKDAERYQLLRRGQKWSVINGIGDSLRAEDLDAAIDVELEKS